MKLRTLIALLVVPACLVGVTACGDDSSTDALSLKDPWSRVTAPGQTAGAVYLTIESKDGDTVTKASVPASIAGMAQLHETTKDSGSGSGDMTGSMDKTETTDSGAMAGGMQGMKEVPSIAIPAGEAVELKPGGYHIMLMELKAPIKDGQKFPVTLTFTKAGTKTVDAVARP